MVIYLLHRTLLQWASCVNILKSFPKIGVHGLLNIHFDRLLHFLSAEEKYLSADFYWSPASTSRDSLCQVAHLPKHILSLLISCGVKHFEMWHINVSVLWDILTVNHQSGWLRITAKFPLFVALIWSIFHVLKMLRARLQEWLKINTVVPTCPPHTVAHLSWSDAAAQLHQKPQRWPDEKQETAGSSLRSLTFCLYPSSWPHLGHCRLLSEHV